MNEEINKAINQLYEAFSDVPKPASIGYCSHCYSEYPYSQLIEKPLRSLTDEDLSEYHLDVFNTGGDKQDFLYFFPRMCELAITEQPQSSLNIELVLEKVVHHTDWQNWPIHHKAKFIDLAESIFNSFSQVRYYPFQVDSWICGLSFIYGDIAALLRVLLLDSEPARFNLAYFYDLNKETLLEHQLSNEWWKKDSLNHNRVVEWFESEIVQQRIREVSHIAVWPCEW
jgi:hypothetical protein